MLESHVKHNFVVCFVPCHSAAFILPNVAIFVLWSPSHPKPFRSDASLRMLRWCHLPQRCAWQLACGQRMWTSKPSSWSDVVSHRRWLYGFFLYILYCCNCAIESSRQIIYTDEASGVQQDSEHPANSTWKPWLMSHGPTCREVVENKIIHSQLVALARIPICNHQKNSLLGLDQPGRVCQKSGSKSI